MTVEVLGVIEGIKARPEMYIGGTDATQLAEEILDNSIDEIVNGYASSISVTLKNNEITVTDNGRGIPHFTNVNGKQVYAPVAVCTELHSSGKIGKNHKKLYNIHVGRHGVGLTVVNALSKYLEIETYNRGYVLNVRFENGKLVHCERKKKDGKGTTVKLKPVNELSPINENVIVERLKLLAGLTTGEIIYNNNVISNDIKHILKELLPCKKIISACAKDGLEYCNVYFTWDDLGKALTPVMHTIVNMKRINSAPNTVLKIISKSCEKLKIVTAEQSLYRLRVVNIMMLKEPVFDSQHKIRLISDIPNKLQSKLATVIDNIVKSTDFVKECLEETQLLIAQKASSKRKRTSKKRINLSYFKDCEQRPGKRLYIVEGKSAEGTLLDVRNPKTEAIFPLKGKIMNVIEQPLSKIAKSQVVIDLLKVVGFDFKRLDPNYENIIICTDPDPDGSHIAALVSLIIWKFTTELIKQKRVHIVQTPLWGIVNYKKKEFIPYKNRPSSVKPGFQLVRFKGLGEFEPWQFRQFIRNNDYLYTISDANFDVNSLKEKKLLLSDIVKKQIN